MMQHQEHEPPPRPKRIRKEPCRFSPVIQREAYRTLKDSKRWDFVNDNIETYGD